MIERRKYFRFPVDIILEDIFELDAFISKERGRILNLSLGGLAFVSQSHYEPNTNLVFSFTLPNKMKIKNIHGKVVWVNSSEENQWKHGIKFLKYGILNFIKLILFLKSLKKNI
jgi:c-di-GMP-binding flagellar brake protein YcgR